MKLPLAVFGLTFALAHAATGGDWPQFRGPHASGVDASAAVPTTWNVGTGSNVLWKTAIPGLAHAAPIIWGDRVYLATSVGAGDADLKVGLYGDIGAADDQAESFSWRRKQHQQSQRHDAIRPISRTEIHSLHAPVF